MLTEDQAEVASKALLDEPRKAQKEHAVRLAAAKGRRFPRIKGLAIGALSGLVAGAVLGYFFAGEVGRWSIVGLSVGMTMGIGFDRRPET